MHPHPSIVRAPSIKTDVLLWLSHTGRKSRIDPDVRTRNYLLKWVQLSLSNLATMRNDKSANYL